MDVYSLTFVFILVALFLGLIYLRLNDSTYHGDLLDRMLATFTDRRAPPRRMAEAEEAVPDVPLVEEESAPEEGPPAQAWNEDSTAEREKGETAPGEIRSSSSAAEVYEDKSEPEPTDESDPTTEQSSAQAADEEEEEELEFFDPNERSNRANSFADSEEGESGEFEGLSSPDIAALDSEESEDEESEGEELEGEDPGLDEHSEGGRADALDGVSSPSLGPAELRDEGSDVFAGDENFWEEGGADPAEGESESDRRDTNPGYELAVDPSETPESFGEASSAAEESVEPTDSAPVTDDSEASQAREESSGEEEPGFGIVEPGSKRDEVGDESSEGESSSKDHSILGFEGPRVSKDDD